MSHALYRLGRFCVRRRGTVLLAWLLLLGIVLGAAFLAGGEFRDAFSIPGTESQQAADLLDGRFPEFAGSTATVVAAGDDLTVRPDLLTDLAADLAAMEGVAAVTDPFALGSVNPAGDTVRFTVSFPTAAGEVDPALFDQVSATVADAAGDGVELAVGGDVASALTVGQTGGTTEAVGVFVAIIVLAVTFGQLGAMGFTLFTALIGVGVSIGSLLAVAALTDIPSVAEVLGLMIGLAVGIDYALFIVSRHVEQVRRHAGSAGPGPLDHGDVRPGQLVAAWVAGPPAAPRRHRGRAAAGRARGGGATRRGPGPGGLSPRRCGIDHVAHRAQPVPR